MVFDPQALQMDAELQTHIRQTIQTVLNKTGSPGAAVTLLLDGQTVFTGAVGFRDVERSTQLDVNAAFYIYSVTKSLIATQILQLVEQGCIALDAPVQRYLPQLNLDVPVSLGQLLNHSGGIPDYGGLPAYFEALKTNPQQPWSSEEFLAATLSNGLNFSPGQGWGYSNIGFLLLRQVIETVLQQPLRAALHEHIFAPLQLGQTCVAQTLQDASQLTPGYSSFFTADKSLQDIHALYHPGWVSHGLVISTAAELARCMDAILSGELLQPQSRAALLEAVDVPTQHALFQQPAYGLGMMVDRKSRHGLLAGHAGGGPGYSAAALHLPAVQGQRITCAALTNCDQDEAGLQIAFALIMQLADLL